MRKRINQVGDTSHPTPAPAPPPQADDGDGQTFHSVGSEAPMMTAILGLVRQAWGLGSVWQFRESAITEQQKQEIRLGSGDTPNHRGLRALLY